MSANVRCAGGGEWFPGGVSTSRSCGWKGTRKSRIYAPVTFTFVGGGRHIEDRWLAVDPTAKPCPQCGGRVELIPQDGGS